MKNSTIAEFSESIKQMSLRESEGLTLWNSSEINTLMKKLDFKPLMDSDSGRYSYWGHPDGLIVCLNNETADLFLISATANISKEWGLQHGSLKNIISDYGYRCNIQSITFQNTKDSPNIWFDLYNKYSKNNDFLPLKEWGLSILETVNQEICDWNQDNDFLFTLQINDKPAFLNSQAVSNFLIYQEEKWLLSKPPEEKTKFKQIVELAKNLNSSLSSLIPSLFENNGEVNPNENQRKTIHSVLQFITEQKGTWQELEAKLKQEEIFISPLTICMAHAEKIPTTGNQNDINFSKTTIQAIIKTLVRDIPTERIKEILATEPWWTDSLKTFLVINPMKEFPLFIQEFKKNHPHTPEDFRFLLRNMHENTNTNKSSRFILELKLDLNQEETDTISNFFKDNEELFIDSDKNKRPEFEALFNHMRLTQSDSHANTIYSILEKQMNEIQIQKKLEKTNSSSLKPTRF